MVCKSCLVALPDKCPLQRDHYREPDRVALETLCKVGLFYGLVLPRACRIVLRKVCDDGFPTRELSYYILPRQKLLVMLHYFFIPVNDVHSGLSCLAGLTIL